MGLHEVEMDNNAELIDLVGECLIYLQGMSTMCPTKNGERQVRSFVKHIQRRLGVSLIKSRDIDYSDIPPITDFSGFERLYPDATADTIITDEMVDKALSNTDWDKVDTIKDEDMDYSDAPELTEADLKRSFIRKGSKS